MTSVAAERRGAFVTATGVRLVGFLMLVGILCGGVVPMRLSGQGLTAPSSSEYDVKAVFLYHFTRYLEWPPESDTGTFEIVVYGESEIVGPLRTIARKKVVGSSPMVVRQCHQIEAIGHPRILFVARSAVGKFAQVLEATRGTAVLVVGEAEGLGARGAAVNFVQREATIRFEINEKALRDTRIQISSQLLRLAILIESR